MLLVDDIEKRIENRIKDIESARENNDALLICVKQNKVILPFTIDELEEYIRHYPIEYPSRENVLKTQYMIPLDTISKKPLITRFKETYYLMKLREMKNWLVSVVYALLFAIKFKVNPAIIAACKTKAELLEYVKCIKEHKEEMFKPFKIITDIRTDEFTNQILTPLSKRDIKN